MYSSNYGPKKLLMTNAHTGKEVIILMEALRISLDREVWRHIRYMMPRSFRKKVIL